MACATSSQAMAVVGASPSAVTVKDVAAEVRPAPFVAVTSLGSAGSAADASKLYVPPVSVQPVPSVGKAYEAGVKQRAGAPSVS